MSAMLAPEEMGRYRVLAPIGRGGMGMVFAGEHTVLRRPVAIKVLHSHLVSDATMARRMMEEARTIARLQHPGIVEVLDVGSTDDGRTYVVMERLAGEPMSDRLRRGRLSEDRAVAFSRQLASALGLAHGVGVIHRDLKPENIFIVPDGDVPGGERVKILDFGIAKRLSDAGENTQTGIVLGTPQYMAPEQCAGQKADVRTDIYALGVVIYLMVSGELPFGGSCTEEIFAEHVFCAPKPVTSLAPVSVELAAIIERCLAKKPEARYQSMDALLVELDRLDASGSDDDITGVVALPAGTPLPAAPVSSTRMPSLATGTGQQLIIARPNWTRRVAIAGSAVVVGIAAALVLRWAQGSAPTPRVQGERAVAPVAGAAHVGPGTGVSPASEEGNSPRGPARRDERSDQAASASATTAPDASRQPARASSRRPRARRTTDVVAIPVSTDKPARAEPRRTDKPTPAQPSPPARRAEDAFVQPPTLF